VVAVPSAARGVGGTTPAWSAAGVAVGIGAAAASEVGPATDAGDGSGPPQAINMAIKTTTMPINALNFKGFLLERGRLSDSLLR